MTDPAAGGSLREPSLFELPRLEGALVRATTPAAAAAAA